ncbi:SpoIID/LytB domain-containing protein [Bacillus sp. DTU_2020_1000418_1_SI_GHA_SEK_038]|uniref:SpoIID/LytB domain-containing protein n=1 Tax=Bacillus sp. DTU_2020_1000418_1_SI_GHA_SEK_038 TaxID=3077585 RepID=UPI0028E25F31|nr:SpoIID/LytB domain-containing protein [Bacillus sp. DTU_2020_1000418_1_SI_GHA_SEK_038]WNS75108.1 SpoIID/LytB domain-containing protein [Bacillus sp. DTU_2020_1000418_1_SI_GHA_SEK_038]
MKKFISIIASFLLLLVYLPTDSKASELVNYLKEVNVSVHLATSVTLTANGNYQLSNKDTAEITEIPQGTVLTVKKDSSNVNVTFNGTSLNSVTGFDLQEKISSSTSLVRVSNGITYRGSFFLKPNGSKVEIINILDMEDYLKGVVPSEMPASFHKEALKAQAISARSYAANTLMLTSTAASQVYRGYSGEDARTNAAIKETEGMLVKYNGKPIQTFFFSTSGGRTANVGDVWNSKQEHFPYLVSVDDPYESSPFSNWTESFPAETLLKSFGFTDLSAQIYDITLSKTGANGEVRGVTVKTSAGDKTVTGNESIIRNYFPLNNPQLYNKLQTNWFDIQLNGSASQNLSVQTSSGTSAIGDLKGQKVQTASGEVTLSDSKVSIQTANGVMTNEGTGNITSVTLNGKGWGHRVGMSQYGAKGFAERGWTAEQILTHYFQGTTVSK